MHSWRNWIACQPPTLKVVGSIPAGCTNKKSPPVGLFLLVCPAASFHWVRPAEGGTRRSAPKYPRPVPPVGLFLLVCPAASTHRVRPAEGGTRRSAPKYPRPAPPWGFFCWSALPHRPTGFAPPKAARGACAEVSPPRSPPVGLFLLVCPAASIHRVRPAEGGTRRSAPKYPRPAPRGAFFVGLPCRIGPPGSSRRRRHEALCAEVSPPRSPLRGFFCWSALPHRSTGFAPPKAARGALRRSIPAPPPVGLFLLACPAARSKDCRPRAEWRAGGKLFPETFTAQKARSAPR